MKFKKIVGFGDSWMYGDELLDPNLVQGSNSCDSQNEPYRLKYCFLGQLGEHYGVPTENYGFPGSSLQSMLWTFQWWLNNEPNPLDCLVLVGLTNSERISHYDPNRKHRPGNQPWNNFVHSTWLDIDNSDISNDFVIMAKQHLVLTTCPEFFLLNYQQSVLMFDGIAARRNIPMIQFHIRAGKCLMPHCPTLVCPDFSFFEFFQGMPNDQKKQMIKPKRHPTEVGHTLIRDRLISQIDSCIM
jgi:hypothetical protein